MKNCGHSYTFRMTILKRVVVKYLNSLSNHQEGRKLMYRNSREREEQKEERKGLNRNDTWFRRGGYTSTLTVPPSPGGKLASIIEENLRKGRQPKGTKTKIVEGNGLSSSLGLVKSNQFPRAQCQRQDCQMCVQESSDNKRTLCDKSNIGYEGECLRCVDAVHKYVGESSRTGFTRIREHMSDYRSASAANLPPQPPDGFGTAHQGHPRKPVKSWMWEHTRDVHGGQLGDQQGLMDYRFKVTNVFRKCLQWQIDEGLRIMRNENEGCMILNSIIT